MKTSSSLLISSMIIGVANAWVPMKTTGRRSTSLFIEQHIADMVDHAYLHQKLKKTFKAIRKEKNEKVLEKELPKEFEYGDISQLSDNPDKISPRQLRKDQKLADKDPSKYCQERCLQSGNCEVYEDFFDFSPTEVAAFCNNCVLSEDDEPCDIPEQFYENIEEGVTEVKQEGVTELKP